MHFEHGRDYHRAVQSLQQAATNAIQRYAHREAISHLTRALELLQTLPDSPERAQQELTLHVTLGPVLIATKGYAALVERVYTRARRLCQETGESRQLFSVLVGLRRSHQVRAEYSIAHELWEAESHRLQGELLLQCRDHTSATGVFASPEAAEACFRQAIAIANHQQAKSWELRAAMSLARLWQSQGKRAAAHALLAEIHDWFAEGFQTPDLRETRVLLDELA